MQSREQIFAAEIYEQVINRHGSNLQSTEATEYGSMAHKLPILIHTAGLVQALTFLSSRGKDSQKELLDDLAQVVLRPRGMQESLLERSRTDSLGEYMALTERTLTALKWYKRFAQSVLEVDSTDGEEQS